MKRIKGFIFDFDNTLVFTDELIVRSLIDSFKEITGITLKVNDIISNYGPSEEGIILNLTGNVVLTNIIFSKYLDIYKNYQEIYIPRLNKIILDSLKNIKNNGFKLFLVTGRSKESMLISLKHLNLLDVFNKCYSGSLLGINKRESFKKLLKENKLDNEEVIYFGDSFNDIKSCKEVNIKLYSCSYFYNEEYKEKIAKLNTDNLDSIDKLKNKIDEIIDLNKCI